MAPTKCQGKYVSLTEIREKGNVGNSGNACEQSWLGEGCNEL